MKYIIDCTPKIINEIDENRISRIENDIINNIEIPNNDIEYLLECLCYMVRCMFTNDLENYSFEYKCDTAQSIIYYYLESLNIGVYACQTQNAITRGVVGHSFITCIINDIPYLIDPTYKQFFLNDNCTKNNYIKIDNKIIKTPDPGYFIKEEDKYLISKLLKNGYSVLSKDIARIYGDSFYNTKPLESPNFKSIKGSVYINAFLRNTSKLSKTKEELSSLGMLIECQNHNKVI